MKKVIVALIVLLVLGGGGFAAWWFYFKPQPPEQTPADEVAASDSIDGTTVTSTDATVETNNAADTADPDNPLVGRAKPGDISRLTVPSFVDWTGKYDQFLHSWTYQYTGKKADDAPDGISRFYIGRMPDTAPRDLQTYAKRLREDANFQDIGYLYDEVDDTEVYEDGWLIQGKVKDTTRPDAATILSFVLYRTVQGIHLRCRGSAFPDAKLRQAAINGCRRAMFQ
jgi:hypothetical protein